MIETDSFKQDLKIMLQIVINRLQLQNKQSSDSQFKFRNKLLKNSSGRNSVTYVKWPAGLKSPPAFFWMISKTMLAKFTNRK